MSAAQQETSVNISNSNSHVASYYPWLVWGLAAAFFCVEYFARVAPGVMVPELMREFGVNALELGGLGASFYYAYILMQLPVGMLMDRYGPRFLLTTMSLLCGVSCWMFATAGTLLLAELARVLLGFASAFAFVGALKLASVWFPSRRIGLLAGLTQALGMLGASIGEPAVAFGVHSAGWRPSLLYIAAAFVVLALAIAVFVRDHAPSVGAAQESLQDERLWSGLWLVLTRKQSWVNALFAGLLFSPTAALGELWGASYFQHSHGLSQIAAAEAVSFLFLGWAVGGPAIGWLSDRLQRRKPVMLVAAVCCFVFLALALYLPGVGLGGLGVLLFAYGVSNTGVGVAYAAATEINPRRMAGASLAFANMMSILIGAAFQPLIGWVLDLHASGEIVQGVPVYTAVDFRLAAAVLPLAVLLSVIVVCFFKETHCQPVQN